MADWIADLRQGRVSRREFVERAVAGGLGLAATQQALAQAPRKHHPRAAGKPAPDSPDRDRIHVNPFAEWLAEEGIPVYRDYGITNLRELKLAPWARLGVTGAYVDLRGGEGVNAAYVCEIAKGARTHPQRYLFEEVVYVLDGEGETTMWSPGGPRHTVRWQPGSIIAPPLNAWRQHASTGERPARLLAINNAPVVIDLFHDAEFVFNNDFVFPERWEGARDLRGGADPGYRLRNLRGGSKVVGPVFTYEGAFVPDARQVRLADAPNRGPTNGRVELQLSRNSMQAHVSQWASGAYKKAHRHGPGSHVVMLNGSGYTLMWKDTARISEARDVVRVDWRESSLFVPPDRWFHQHFNTSFEDARYLAATWGGGGRYHVRALGGGGRAHGSGDLKRGGNTIAYEDEDPLIREMFEAELKKNGVENRMGKDDPGEDPE